MKFLADLGDTAVKSVYEAPLDFSVSGKLVVDVPSYLGITSFSGTVASLITAKNAALLAQYPSMSGLLYEEFLDATGVNLTLSERVLTGVNKRTAMLPSSGTLITQTLSIAVPVTKVLFHCSPFTLAFESPSPSADRPGPGRLLYEDVPPSGAALTVSLMSPDLVTTHLAVIPESEQSFASAPLSFRIKFVNLTASPLYLGDWALLYG